MDYAEQTDESLLALIGQGDTEALAACYDRHAQAAFNLIMRIVGDPASADDLLQDTFWMVWQKAAEFQGGGSAAGWLYRIARNKSLDLLRRRKARPATLSAHSAASRSVLDHLPAEGLGVEQITEHAFRRQTLRSALDGLPHEQRLCLELAYFEGMTQQQIAAQTGAPLGTVKTRLKMGLQKLERTLRAAGYRKEDDA